MSLRVIVGGRTVLTPFDYVKLDDAMEAEIRDFGFVPKRLKIEKDNLKDYL